MTLITSSRLRFSIINMDDAQAVFETLNYENTALSISFLSWPMTIKQAQDWCLKAESGYKNKSEYIFIACLNSVPVGCIGIHLNTKEPDSAEIGYWVDKNHQGKGIASEMLASIINFAKKNLQLKALFATTNLHNDGSARVLEKVGFKFNEQVDVKTPNGMRVSNKYSLRLREQTPQ